MTHTAGEEERDEIAGFVPCGRSEDLDAVSGPTAFASFQDLKGGQPLR